MSATSKPKQLDGTNGIVGLVIDMNTKQLDGTNGIVGLVIDMNRCSYFTRYFS